MILASANATMKRSLAGLWFPRQLALFFAVEVLEIIGVHFDGAGGVWGIRTCRALPRRARWRRRRRAGVESDGLQFFEGAGR